MKWFITMTLTVLIVFSLNTTSTANPLSGYKWKNRIVVMSVGDNAKAVANVIKKERAGLLDRDLIVIDVSENPAGIQNTIRPAAESLKSLRDRLSLSGKETQFVLIGKDGGVKARQKGQLNLRKFFALIDTMPIRKEEMRNR